MAPLADSRDSIVLTVARDQPRSDGIRSATSVAVRGRRLDQSISITSSSASLMRRSISHPFGYICKRIDYRCKHKIRPKGAPTPQNCRIFLRIAAREKSPAAKIWQKTGVSSNWHARCYYYRVHLVPRHEGAVAA